MKKRYADEYASKLCEEFPQIDKKEMKRIINDMTVDLSIYLKTGFRGFSVSDKNNTLAQDGKMYKFVISRVFGKRHLVGLKNRKKVFKQKKDEQ